MCFRLQVGEFEGHQAPGGSRCSADGNYPQPKGTLCMAVLLQNSNQWRSLHWNAVIVPCLNHSSCGLPFVQEVDGVKVLQLEMAAGAAIRVNSTYKILIQAVVLFGNLLWYWCALVLHWECVLNVLHTVPAVFWSCHWCKCSSLTIFACQGNFRLAASPGILTSHEFGVLTINCYCSWGITFVSGSFLHICSVL